MGLTPDGEVKDHPRVCGEHNKTMTEVSPSFGSSPRMRGALRVPRLSCSPTRIIPAYAGSTSQLFQIRHAIRDHPRVRGVHRCRQATDRHHWGSSPRMRGAPGCALHRILAVGIIPAYAGSTHTGTAPITSTKDHPRVCGEHGRY